MSTQIMEAGKFYMTGAGNVVSLREITGGYAFIDRIGYLDSHGDSHDKYERTWAKVSEEWLKDIQHVFSPTVRMIGGGWMLEDDYADMQSFNQTR